MAAALCCAAGTLTSCSDNSDTDTDNPPPGQPGISRYVIAAQATTLPISSPASRWTKAA